MSVRTSAISKSEKLTPFLSIGVLAHNEEGLIKKTLKSLFTQDVFHKIATELIVVANGCTDATATVANRTLEDHSAVWAKSGSARVEVVPIAGKANAWNKFVHNLSSPSATMLILMDADILFLDMRTISSMVETLHHNPQAVVCVDRPVKDIEINPRRTFFQHLLVAATPQIDPSDAPLCGQLYCAVSTELRAIDLPAQLPGEDGFLRALLLTHGFTRPEDKRRIILDATAVHRFTSVASLSDLFKHEKWIISCAIIDMFLFERFWRECTANRSAMAVMRQWQEVDPDWLSQFIQREVKERGWRLLPRQWWTRRWSRWSKLPLGHKLTRLPIAGIASILDMLIFVAAIKDVRSGRVFGYWRLGTRN